MFVSKVRVVDFKCFLDSDAASFDPSFNVIVGRNNAGKSALLEALNIVTPPQANLHASPSAPQGLQRASKVQFSVNVSTEDIVQTVRRYDQTLIAAPNEIGNAEEYLQQVLSLGAFDFGYELAMSSGSIEGPHHPAVSLPDRSYGNRCLQLAPESDGVVVKGIVKADDSMLPGQILEQIKRRFFVFRAERLNIGRSDPAEEAVLKSDASNLPAVLHRLQEDPHAMTEYIAALRAVIPSVAHVSVGLRQKQFVIQVIPDFAGRGQSYSQTLENSGTGVGQVMALLYVVLNTQDGVVVIDEPNSFLHPGATKELINIMRQHRRNQYIISTHSPEVIVASSPCRVVQVERTGGESKLKSFESGAISTVRGVLEDLGVSLSDVFGIDAIIWVEGETERDAFPLVLEAFGVEMLRGAAFVPMRASELSAKRRIAEISADLHNRLTTASAIMPTFLSFAFDGELRNEAERSRIQDTLGGRARFLPVRMLENYLFHAEAISKAIRMENVQSRVTTADVSELLTSAHGFQESDGVLTHPDIATIDGYAVLKDVFWAKGTISYSKTRDSVRLIEILLEDDKSVLAELASYIQSLIPAAKES